MADEPKTDLNPTGGETGQDDASTGEARFTQADLDRAIERRLARERAKYADYDRLKAEAETAAQALQEARAEADGRLQALESDRLDKVRVLEARLDEARKSLTAERVRNGLAAAAARAGACDSEQVAVLLGGRARLDADGRVTLDGTDAEEGVRAYLAANPHLVRPAARGGAGSATNRPEPGTLSREAIRAMSPEEFRRHEREILEAARKGLIR